VVGQADVNGTQTDPFYWKAGTGMVDLGNNGGGTYGRAENIDNSGNIVGKANDAGGNPHAYTYAYPGGPLIDQDAAIGQGGNQSIIYTRTDNGLMVGWANNGVAQQSMFYNGTSWINIGAPGGLARGVNSSGLVVGGTSSLGAYEWTQAEGLVTQGFFGGTFAENNYVNESNQTVGHYILGGVFHPYSYTSAGGMVDLGSLGGSGGIAWKLNAYGEIVGFSTTALGAQHAMMYMGGVMYDLNSLMDSSGTGWTLTVAQGINDYGWIVGTGTDPLGHAHAFLLIAPEPSGCALLVGGLGLLTCVIRRRNLR